MQRVTDPATLAPLPVDVISIQSQVAYGCVGNSVAVPTLQELGLNVVAIPTVLLSNVPHYDSLSGGAVPLEWFEGFLADVERRGALRHARAVLVGYLGSPQQASTLAVWLERITNLQPNLLVIIDPVMGDHDSGLYVHPDLPAALRDELARLADGLTPNAFELERLVGRSLPTVEATVVAARELLVGRTKWVVVTSAAPDQGAERSARVVVVTASDHVVLNRERVESAAKGTGDLFTAALTAALLGGGELENAVDVAHDRVVDILQRTHRLGCAELVLNDI